MESPLILLPREIKSLLLDYGPGRVFMAECGVCGWLRWLSTYKTEPDGVHIEVGSATDCARCVQAMQRAPEVFQWVAGVVGRLSRQIREQVPTFDVDHPDKPMPSQSDPHEPDQTPQAPI